MKKYVDKVSDETRRYCASKRSELTYDERADGWDYDWFYSDGCIYGAFFSPDGDIFDIILLQDLTNLV